MLVAPLQQINPALPAAAQSLGANRITTHFTVILPLCLSGIAQVFMLIYASAISAFVIPLILGRGQVSFLSNLVYARFSEVSDFPGGSALSVLLLAITLTVTLGLGWIVTYASRVRLAP
jgi:ABC-type spermidine/putrescine transport system permease subunit I